MLETPPPFEIKPVEAADFEEMYLIINDAATAYRGIIPADRWHDPYMPREELRAGIADGIEFSGAYENGRLNGVMGIQDRSEVALIRHAYIRTVRRNAGIGGKLLDVLCASCPKPILIGTLADAIWAVRFYQKHGFTLISDPDRKSRLLRRFWGVPERQIETSVVLEESRRPYCG